MFSAPLSGICVGNTGERFRVMRADSGPTALELVKQLKLRNEALALFLVDQRMPRMSGVEFLAEALKDFPSVKRALLTAYADTDAAINAINSVQIDYYLMKPWDPPEERLYPGPRRPACRLAGDVSSSL